MAVEGFTGASAGAPVTSAASLLARATCRASCIAMKDNRGQLAAPRCVVVHVLRLSVMGGICWKSSVCIPRASRHGERPRV